MTGTEIVFTVFVVGLLAVCAYLARCVSKASARMAEVMNDRSDRDDLRLGMLTSQVLAISEMNLEAQRLERIPPEATKPRKHVESPALEEIFPTTAHGEGAGFEPA